MTQFEPLLWERRIRRQRTRFGGATGSTIDPRTEFTDRPLGKLGQPLLTEVETYLAFFALAREPVPDVS
jgi:hypothetical protein